jgi:hypothetical protein
MPDVDGPPIRESQVRSVHLRRSEYAETQAKTGHQPARREEVILVQQHRLEELRECQRRLTSLVEGYLLALEQVGLCRDLRTRVGKEVGRPEQLAEYDFWDGIRQELDQIGSFAADLASPESELDVAVRSFNAALREAKARVDEGAERYAQSEEAELKGIALSALKSIREMTDSIGKIVEKCPGETRNVLGRIASCIERILDQSRPGDLVKISSQLAAVGYGQPQTVDEPMMQLGRLVEVIRDLKETRRGEAESVAAEGGRVPFKLQITGLTDQRFAVQALETPMGEPHGLGRLPCDPADLIAVLKVLELGYGEPDLFSEAQREVLQGLGLVRDGFLTPDLLPSLGRGLYQALFPGKIEAAFQMALNQAKVGRVAVALQLRFHGDAVALARYPWELLHDGYRHLLPSGAVELTRYIAYPEAVTDLKVRPPWRLLFIAPRPGDLAALPDDAERRAVWEGLQPLDRPGRLAFDRLAPPTYKALLDCVRGGEYHIVHFDGHGVFARRCPRCEEMHYPHSAVCQSCGAPLDGVRPLGYLAFEGRDGNADYVSTEAMGNLLLRSKVRLVFLSACQSGVVRGESLFGGLGPGLILAGVPAVVAMQFSVPVDAAVDFAKGFYTALAQGETVPRAVAEGRMGLFRSKTWYIPTLYLRSTDDEGRLFIE